MFLLMSFYFADELRRNGVEYLTREPCYGNIFTSYVLIYQSIILIFTISIINEF